MRSLFWTFAGTFVLVLLTTVFLQALVIVSVVQPWSSRQAAETAERVVRSVAGQIAESDDRNPAELRRLLRAPQAELGRTFLLYADEEQNLVAGHRIPPPLELRYSTLIAEGVDPGIDAPAGAFESRPDRPREGSPDRRPPGPAGRRGPPSGRRPGGPGPGAGPDFDDPALPGLPPPRTLEILSRELVEGGGMVLALRPDDSFPLWPRDVPRPVLLFFPLAIVMAGVAAFILFRHFVRRLRALEGLANRVTEGDLTARVSDLGQDEIGRLGDRLNAMTESLANARQRIDEEDRARRRLVADISHELATPMTSIQGYAETLNDPDVPISEPEQRTFLRSILDETMRLKALIRDLFDLTRLEAGAIPLERETVDLTALAQNTQRRFAPRFAEAGLSLHWQGDAAPAWASLDGRRIEQVVDNLLSNALRYVPEGGRVEMSVTAGAGEHVLTVRDDGPGIPAEHVGQVFDRFYRVDEARTSEGTGLGLAISREIVERHDGTIAARNRERGGAEFTVRLPASSA